MKKILAILILMAIMVPAPLDARTVKPELYVIDVPSSWQAKQSGQTITLTSPDKNCLIIVTEGSSALAHRKTVEPLVKAYSKRHGKTFEHVVTITRLRWQRVIVTIAGDHPDRVPIYYSIKAKKPHVKG